MHEWHDMNFGQEKKIKLSDWNFSSYISSIQNEIRKNFIKSILVC